jgi:cytochrome c oxidase subunit I
VSAAPDTIPLSVPAPGNDPARAPDLAERLERIWSAPHTAWGWFATVDHKRIGIRYLFTAFVLLLVGGVEAVLMRLQLIGPERRLLSPEAYNQVFTMHGLTMILWYAAPVLSGFGNYLVPLLIGSRDMAFPRLNAFSYWMFLLSGLLLYVSVLFGQAPDAGWFAYVPLAARRYNAGLNMDFYPAAVTALTISTTAGAINFIVTIFKHRAPGMTFSRMPLFLYSTGTTAFLSVLALPALTVACVFLELDRRWGTHFFQVRAGGDPVLWQHLFWFFGHPWVYIVFLPATGMLAMVIPTFSRRPMVGHTFVALSTVTTGLVGFGVWVHHMFATGLPQLSMTFFGAASITVSIPSAVQIFAWLATMYYGRVVYTTSMLFAIAFIVQFVIGGISGVMTAAVPFDWQVTDTYFIVAHIHYVLAGGTLFGVLAAIYYWYPKMYGRLLDERLGKLSFWLLFIGFNLAFFPMHVSGMLGMTRRVYTYASNPGLDTTNLLSTIGAYVFALGFVVTLWNVIKSRVAGHIAGPNPWGAGTLEWLAESPPEDYNFARIPIVTGRDPLWTQGVTAGPAFDEARLTPRTSALDADLQRPIELPHENYWAVATSVTLLVTFSALLIRSYWLFGVALAVTLCGAACWMWPLQSKVAETEV